MSNIDLSQLAVDRSSTEPMVRAQRSRLTRYVLPSLLILGFFSLVLWSAYDFIVPPKVVRVIPVLATQSMQQDEGTPLFQAAGWIEPRPTPVRVAALADGIVEKLLVVEDQFVKAGEPVAELIKDDAQLSYQAALADQQLREAEVEQVKASLTAAVTRLEQPVHLEAALGEANAELARIETILENLPFETSRAESQLAFAKEDYLGKNAAKRAIARRTLDAAQSELETAQATLAELKNREQSLRLQARALEQRRDALKTQLELLSDELEARDSALAKIKAAEARLALSRVAVAEAKLRLDRMTVRSPIDGRIYRLLGHPGADTAAVMVAMQGHDARTIVTLYRPDMLQVRVDVRFEDTPKVSLNQVVEIDNPAIPNPILGKVLYISSEADIQKNTLQVKVAIESPPELFKPEMLVDVTFLEPKREQHDPENGDAQAATKLFLPQSFLHADESGQQYVWVADQSAGVAKRTSVEVGSPVHNGLIEIRSGLNRADRIITSDVKTLSDNVRIYVEGEDSTT